MTGPEEIQSFLKAYVSNWNEPGNALGELFHPEGTLLVPGNDEALNVAEVERFVGGNKAALPDIRIRLLSWAERDGELFTEFEMSATIRGRKQRWRGINKNRLRGAKSVEAVSYWDRLGLLENVHPERPRERLADTLQES